MFKTNNLQHILYTSLADDINVTNNNLYIYVPNLLPSVETQVMFNETAQNNYKISYDEFFTERRVISDMITQLDIGSSKNVLSPKYLFGAHQTRTRAYTVNKNNDNIAIFDKLDLRKYFVEIDGLRYLRDSSLMNYEENDYIEQYRGLKLFFKEYIGEPILNPFISYPDMKTKYPFEIIHLRYQPDHLTPKKIHLFHEYGADPKNGRFNLILIRRREIELISDGNKLIEVNVIYMKILNFGDFMKKFNLKNSTTNELELQRANKYPIYRRDSKTYSD